MDTFAALNSILVKLFNDILNIEEKALITEEFKDISVTDMHIIEAIGIAEPRYHVYDFKIPRCHNGHTDNRYQRTGPQRLRCPQPQ